MTEHVSDERLQQFADGELIEAEVVQHVGVCAECSARLDAIAGVDADYRAYHEALKASDPAPPRPWADLRPRMNRRSGSWRAWAAVAATVLVAAGAWYRMTRPAPVSAAELLKKAVAAERPVNAGRRIRVRTAKREVVRPAVLSQAGSGELEALFLTARFSWQDPLSARSFAAWREGLREKRDTVRQERDRYEIETTTGEGALRSATLVLDGALRPVRETLEFTTERVEISEAEPEPAPATIAPAPRTGAPPGVAPQQAGPADELRVIAALHAIGADLGDPVQVAREGGRVVVSTTGLTPAREQQVRDAVAPLPGVTVRIEPIPAGEARATERATVASGTPSQLLGAFGEEGVNRILDASEAVMARAYALRGLSRRFPHDVEAQLADADREVLASIRGEHVAGIRRHLAALEGSLAPLLPKTEVAAAPALQWQARAERVFAAAQTVDRLLSGVLAGGQDFARAAPELAAALRRLDAEVEAWR